ncbi:MAG: hypothetical protein AVO33_04745 [delta proteobacterium ML8_F1]|nr:MAG: hypothetical protein AVO33_04745 [delta proteobacterium ML8_F1]
MHGSAQMLFQYMEGSSKRFIIPVYQRNYDWQIEQCKQLYDDLVKLKKSGANSHFFGSIVSAQDNTTGMQEYLIIDGQQRLTTVSLLLLATYNLLSTGVITAKKSRLQDKILEEYLIDKFEPDDTKMKLKPIKEDSMAFGSLLSNTEDHVKASNITINYNYYFKRIQQRELNADEIFDTFCKLQIINIYLGSEDNPQLIFESLNSTGMDLSEGDKIRNYILMGITPSKVQEKYYEKYWNKIEKCTNYDVSSFIRDYLSVKLQSTPAMKNVYIVFKRFMEQHPFSDKEALLVDLLAYARRYEQLLKANSKYPAVNGCIDRMNRFETTVTRPFFMEILRHAESVDGTEASINPDELLDIIQVIESYLFRRQICEIPTNALNKIFVALNSEIMRLDSTAENYPEKLKYSLRKRTASGIYPDDDMFAEALSTKQVYLMRSKNKQYLMERFENWGTKEVKDVSQLLDNGTYSIEHIMPQTLQNEWKESLGEDYESIHEEWVHRLANLTLTAYNSKYSNSSFQKKRDNPNGFAHSGIRMNQLIAKYSRWTLEELLDRNKKLIDKALRIWPLAETKYEPVVKTLDSITLADDYNLKGRRIARFSFKGAEEPVKSWIDMYVKVVSLLHAENPLLLVQLAEDQSGVDLSNFVSDTEKAPDKYVRLESEIYLFSNTNTETKISLLRRFFSHFGVEEEELVFYLREENEQAGIEPGAPERYAHRKHFWTKALPILKDYTNRFKNVNPTTSNWISTFIGKAGINISTIANMDNLRVELYIGTRNPQLNDQIFKFIHTRKDAIETLLGMQLDWKNVPENRTARISIINENIGIADEEMWEDCIDFLADGVDKLSVGLLPVLEDYYDNN